MKRTRPLLFPLALIVGLGAAFNPLGAQQPGKRAIIVIRHAEDTKGKNWTGADYPNPKWDGEGKKADGTYDKNPFPSDYWKTVAETWPLYPHPYTHISEKGVADALNPNGFNITLHGLSGQWSTKQGKDGSQMEGERPFGEAQARRLAEQLDPFLTKNGFAPITRAVTMYPVQSGGGGAPTPNPFDTLWPYLKKRQDAATPLELFLVQYSPGNDKCKAIVKMIEDEGKDFQESATEKRLLSPQGGSTIICWTGEGLEGEGGIFALLSDQFRKKHDYAFVNGPTARCSDTVIFYRDTEEGIVEQWKLNSGIDGGVFAWKKTSPGEKKRPEIEGTP